jgi:hypothetical protein
VTKKKRQPEPFTVPFGSGSFSVTSRGHTLEFRELSRPYGAGSSFDKEQEKESPIVFRWEFNHPASVAVVISALALVMRDGFNWSATKSGEEIVAGEEEKP